MVFEDVMLFLVIVWENVLFGCVEFDVYSEEVECVFCEVFDVV